MNSLILTILFSFFKALIFVDFVSGIGHWLQDRYATVDMTLIRDSIVIPNQEHHKSPRKFLGHTYWYRNNVTIVSALILGVLFAIAGMNPFTNFFTIIFLANINEVHALAHQERKKTPQWVLACQKIGLLQSKKHHNLHHCSPFEYRYCILTDWLNPILDRLNFFRFLEWVILKAFNAKPN